MALTFSMPLASGTSLACRQQTVQQNRFEPAMMPELHAVAAAKVVSQAGWKTADQPSALVRMRFLKTTQFPSRISSSLIFWPVYPKAKNSDNSETAQLHTIGRRTYSTVVPGGEL
jgi:hypothetical protein